MPAQFGNATAGGDVPARRGGADNQPTKDKTGDVSGGDQQSAQDGERQYGTRREFLRLHWDPLPLERKQPEPMKPVGDALPVVPTVERYDQTDQKMLAQLWDNAMPSYKGLLNARISDDAVQRRWEAA
jgi:hypothetical protein